MALAIDLALAAALGLGTPACSSEGQRAPGDPGLVVRASRLELSPRCQPVAWHRIGQDPPTDGVRASGANLVVTYDFTTRAARSFRCPADWLDLLSGPTEKFFRAPKEAWPAPRPDELARCQQGSADACFDVATALEGSGGVVDPYFEKACDLGNPFGCLVLAQGGDEARWRKRALDSYERRCRAGHRPSCEDGALILREGRGVPKDPAAAKKRFGL